MQSSCLSCCILHYAVDLQHLWLSANLAEKYFVTVGFDFPSVVEFCVI